MENKPEGKRPIEEALSEIGSAFSLFSQVKSDVGAARAAAKKMFFYTSVAWWIVAGIVGFIHRRQKRKNSN